MIYGSKDYSSRKYYGSFFFKSLQGLGNIAHYKNNFQVSANTMDESRTIVSNSRNDEH